MIIPKSKKKEKRLEIDLTGPQGNAYAILGIVPRLANACGKNARVIQKRMMGGDYENLLKAFEAEFGDYVVMYK